MQPDHQQLTGAEIAQRRAATTKVMIGTPPNKHNDYQTLDQEIPKMTAAPSLEIALTNRVMASWFAVSPPRPPPRTTEIGEIPAGCPNLHGRPLSGANWPLGVRERFEVRID